MMNILYVYSTLFYNYNCFTLIDPDFTLLIGSFPMNLAVFFEPLKYNNLNRGWTVYIHIIAKVEKSNYGHRKFEKVCFIM